MYISRVICVVFRLFKSRTHYVFFFLNIKYLLYLQVYKIKTRNYNDFMEYCTLKKCI